MSLMQTLSAVFSKSAPPLGPPPFDAAEAVPPADRAQAAKLRTAADAAEAKATAAQAEAEAARAAFADDPTDDRALELHSSERRVREASVVAQHRRRLSNEAEARAAGLVLAAKRERLHYLRLFISQPYQLEHYRASVELVVRSVWTALLETRRWLLEFRPIELAAIEELRALAEELGEKAPRGDTLVNHLLIEQVQLLTAVLRDAIGYELAPGVAVAPMLSALSDYNAGWVHSTQREAAAAELRARYPDLFAFVLENFKKEPTP